MAIFLISGSSVLLFSEDALGKPIEVRKTGEGAKNLESYPEIPSSPSPEDGDENMDTDPLLSVEVSDPEGDPMNVTFYDASDNSAIGSNTGITNGTTSLVWSGLSPGTTYRWYAVAEDAEGSTQSPTWEFTTFSEDYPYVVSTTPSDGASSVPVDEDITVEFSRAMNVSSVEYRCEPDPGGWSETWTSNDTVLKLSHDDFSAHNITMKIIQGEDKDGNPLTSRGPVNGMEAYWRLDDGPGSSTATDSSENSNHGTLQGGPTWVTGEENGALSFDGTDDHVDCGNDGSLSFPSGEPITITCWAKRSSSPEYSTIIGRRSGSDQNYRMGFDYSQFSFWYYDTGGNWQSYTSDNNYSENTWHHLALTYTFGNGGSMNMFVNGNQVTGSWSGGTGDTDPVTGAYDTCMGRPGDLTGFYFPGAVDELRVYRRELSQNEIKNLTEGSPDTWSFTTTSNNHPPDRPENPDPSHGDNGIDSDPTLSVDVSDPNGDALQVTFYNASDENVIDSTDLSGNGTASVTWPGLAWGQTYRWYATVDDGQVNISSSTWNFRTNGLPSAENPNPSDGSIEVGKNPTLSADCIDPEGHSMNVTFFNYSSGSSIGTDSISGNGTASVSWNDLRWGRTYRWYIEIDDGMGTSTTEDFQFTTNYAPIASNPSPVDGSIGEGKDLTLSVSVEDRHDDPMDVSFFEASNDSLIGAYSVPGNGTASAAWENLSLGETYSWYVKVDDGQANVTSEIWSFTTDHPPSISDPQPADQAVGVRYSPTLKVNITDPEGHHIDITFYNQTSGEMIGTDSITGNGTVSTVWSNLSEGSSYSWSVTADDGVVNRTSEIWNFTTNRVPSVSDPGPIDGAVGVKTNVSLTVNVTDIDGDLMNVSFFETSDDSLIGERMNVSSGKVSIDWSGLDLGTTYSWYVTADDGKGTCESTVWEFTTIPWDVKVNSPPDTIETSTGLYTYQFQVENTGTVNDTYNLSVSSSSPDLSASCPSEVTVSQGSVQEVDVEVSIEDSITEGETGSISFMAESQNGSVFGSDELSITYGHYHVELEAPPDSMVTSTGSHPLSFWLNNTGSLDDSYDLDITSNNSDFSVDGPDQASVISGGSTRVDVDVSVSSNVKTGEGAEITVIASSQNASEVNPSDEAVAILTYETYSFEVDSPEDKIENTTELHTYNFTVMNNGTLNDTYEFNITSSNSDFLVGPIECVSISAEDSIILQLEVNISQSANTGEETEISLNVSSQNASEYKIRTFRITFEGVEDSSAPSSTLSLAKSYTNESKVRIPFNASDDGGLKNITLYYKSDGGQWQIWNRKTIGGSYHSGSFTFEPSNEGLYEFYTICVDSSNNEESDSITSYPDMIVDWSSPVIDDIEPVSGALVNRTEVQMTWEGQDTLSEIKHYEVRKDSEDWIDNKRYTTQTFSALSEGQHEVEIRAQDRAGNWKVVSSSFVVDSKAPSLQIGYPSEGDEISNSSIKIRWSGQDENSGVCGYSIKIDSQNWVDMGEATTYTIENLSKGNHSIKIKAMDEAGNQVSKERHFLFKGTEEDGKEGGGLFKGVCLSPLLLVVIITVILLISTFLWRNREEEPEKIERSMEMESGEGLETVREVEEESTVQDQEKKTVEDERSEGLESFEGAEEGTRMGGEDEKIEKEMEGLEEEEGKPPDADAGRDMNVETGEAVEFDASGSSDEEGIVSYEWYFDDFKTAFGEKVEHTFKEDGIHTVKLVVTNEDGLTAEDMIYVMSKTKEEDEKGKDEEDMERKKEEEEKELKETVETLESFTELKGVGSTMAKRLHDEGFHSMEDLEEASKEELEEVKGIGSKLSEQIIEQLDRNNE